MNVRVFNRDNIFKLEGYLRYLFEKGIDYTTHWAAEYDADKKVIGITGLVVY